MENKQSLLEQALSEYVNLLTAREAAGDENGSPSEPLHIETIDFDRLRSILTDAAAALREAAGRDAEAEVVRGWFTQRIVALQRARKALLGGEGGMDTIDALGRLGWREVLRRFEDESSQLRRSLRPQSAAMAGPSAHKQDKYQDFKS